MLSSDDLDKICSATGRRDYLVEELIPARSLVIAVGDSGLGKTPWGYQLAMSVASGTPFLGYNVRQGRVLILDYENGLEDINLLIARLTRYLALPHPTGDELLVWSYGTGLGSGLYAMVTDLEPRLVIIDSLRSHDPLIDEKPRHAAEMLHTLRGLARKAHASFLLLHHIKKADSRNSPPPLEDAAVMEWLLQASGPRALVNQTDVRLALDTKAGLVRLNSLAGATDEVALLVRGFARVRGEIGPIYLARVLDADDEPIGYRRMVGAELLFNDLQEDAFRRLPSSFTFKEAKLAYGRGDQPTRDFLNKCKALGILRQPARGMYVKV